MGNRITHAAPHLSANAVQERMEKEQRPWCRKRWEIIYQALTAPRQAEDIAKTVGASLATVHQVISSYKRRGVTAIETPGKGGRRRQYLTLQQERAFLQPFLERAARRELATAVEIQLAFEALIGHQVNTSTVYRLLARHGLKHRTDAAGRSAQAMSGQPGEEEASSVRERRKQASTRPVRSRELASQRPQRAGVGSSRSAHSLCEARRASSKCGHA